MNNTKHTLGPWFATPDYRAVYSKDALGFRLETIARIPTNQGIFKTSGSNREYCLLLAAAPELLEALDSLADAAERGSPDLDAYVADARAAIKKAKGE